MTETVDEDDVLDVMAEDENIDDEDDEDKNEDVEEEREVSDFCITANTVCVKSRGYLHLDHLERLYVLNREVIYVLII